MFQECNGPRAVVKFVGREIVGRVVLVAGVGALPIQGQAGDAAAPLLAMGAVPFVGEKMFEGDQEECAKAAFLAGESFEVIFFEKAGEKDWVRSWASSRVSVRRRT